MNDSHPSCDEPLGLAHMMVRLRDHDPRWEQLYAVEAESIRAAMGAHLIEIQHHGSTSVPGLKAKPILDIIAGVPHLDDALALAPALAAIGYEFVPEAGVPEHHVFGKGDPRTHLLHVVEHGSPTWQASIDFRDRLLASRELARAYEQVKVALAAQFPENRAAYTAGKTDFILHALAGKP